MQHSQRSRTFRALLTLGFVLLPSVAGAQSGEPSRDAQSYAASRGVSIEEAVRRLQLQTTIGELNARLESQEQATFAGLWIEHQPEFRVVARFTQNGEQTLARYVTGTPLAGLVQAQPAQVTLARLHEIQKAALAAVAALGVRAEAGLDIRNNTAEVYVEALQAVQAAIAAGTLRLPEHARVVQLGQLSRDVADIYAGLALSPCTSGFAVRNASGTKGITTAGHCSNTVSYNGTALPFQSEAHGTYYDVQWHTAPGFTVRNLLYDGLGTRSITATWGRTSQNVGDYVCHYGKTTGYGCGTIVDKSYTRSTVPNSTATWIRVHEDGVDLSSPGDSGGPWFLSNYAYGIMGCEINTTDACYMAINYISGISVSVLLQ
ncbi:MAG TPA: hypothetical protein VHG28_23275 [Longimicrobiaceae bacterium]|nr:hypothetical protein [Longimicrobiaceae bacterium]